MQRQHRLTPNPDYYPHQNIVRHHQNVVRHHQNVVRHYQNVVRHPQNVVDKVLTFCILETSKRVLWQINGEDPDEMQNNAAFHKDLHCLLRLIHQIHQSIIIQKVVKHQLIHFKVIGFVLTRIEAPGK